MTLNASNLLRLLEPTVRPDTAALQNRQRVQPVDPTRPGTGGAGAANAPFESLGFDDLLARAREVSARHETMPTSNNQPTANHQQVAVGNNTTQNNAPRIASPHPLAPLNHTGAVENASLRSLLHLRQASPPTNYTDTNLTPTTTE